MSKWDTYSKEDFEEILKSEFLRIGSTSYDKYRKNKLPDSPSIQACLNKLEVRTWNEMLKLLNFTPKQQIKGKNRTKGEVLELLKQLYNRIGKIPNYKDIFDCYGFNPEIYRKKFGSFENALKLIGVENFIKRNRYVEYSDEKLINLYREYCVSSGKIIKDKDLKSNKDMFNGNVFIRRFWSFNNVRKLAGIQTIKHIKRYKYSKLQLINTLTRIYIENNGRISQKELEKYDLPPLNSMLPYFKATNLNEIWDQVEEKVKKISQ